MLWCVEFIMGRKKADKGEGTIPSDLGSDWHPAVLGGYSVVEKTAQNVRRRRITVQCPLDFYLHQGERQGRRKGGITLRQHEAGAILMQYWHLSQGTPPSTLLLLGKIRIPFDPARAMSTTEEQANASIEVSWARDTLGGSKDVGWLLVFAVACQGMYLKDLPPHPYYPKTEHLMGRLREALDKLADSYDIPRYKNRREAKRTKRAKQNRCN
jgi:hypothetical protein